MSENFKIAWKPVDKHPSVVSVLGYHHNYKGLFGNSTGEEGKNSNFMLEQRSSTKNI